MVKSGGQVRSQDRFGYFFYVTHMICNGKLRGNRFVEDIEGKERRGEFVANQVSGILTHFQNLD